MSTQPEVAAPTPPAGKATPPMSRSAWVGWGILILVQVGTRVMDRVFWLSDWPRQVDSYLGLLTAVVALGVMVIHRFRWRPSVLAVLVAFVGQLHLIERELTLYIWRTRGFAP